jgi:hypothetical protein
MHPTPTPTRRSNPRTCASRPDLFSLLQNNSGDVPSTSTKRHLRNTYSTKDEYTSKPLQKRIDAGGHPQDYLDLPAEYKNWGSLQGHRERTMTSTAVSWRSMKMVVRIAKSSAILPPSRQLFGATYIRRTATLFD